MIPETEWAMVRSALRRSEWDFRTADGVAKETGLDPERVKEVIAGHRPEVRQAISKDGRIVYTHRSKPMKLREVIAQIQRFASKAF